MGPPCCPPGHIVSFPILQCLPHPHPGPPCFTPKLYTPTVRLWTQQAGMVLPQLPWGL